MIKKIIIIPLLLMSLIIQLGCEKYAEDYKAYLDDKEIVYPGLARNIRYRAGNLRTELIWNPSPDPNITHYLVEWNNGSRSTKVEADTHNPTDSIIVNISELPEYVYSFTITAFDKQGNRSIGQQVHNVRVYGPSFQAILLNRRADQDIPYELTAEQELRIRFGVADSMNVTTRVNYLTNQGTTKTLFLSAQQNDLVLPDYKYGTTIKYRSGYLPEENALDTLFALQDAEFPVILRPIDKSLFHDFFLPGDAESAWGWILPYAWDNSLEEPGFHTADFEGPLSFTIDMGEAQSLKTIKLWQRVSALYDHGNPRVLEVWGSNNPSVDGSWESWDKLETFTMNKPSGLPLGEQTDEDIRAANAGHEFEFNHLSEPIRYLRVRVLETWGKTPYMHLLEIALYSDK